MFNIVSGSLSRAFARSMIKELVSAAPLKPLNMPFQFAAATNVVRFQSNRADLKYTEKHEWIRVNGNQGIVGITDYAQVIFHLNNFFLLFSIL